MPLATRLGMNSGAVPSTIHNPSVSSPVHGATGAVVPMIAPDPEANDHEGDKDYFIHKDGLRFAGTHLLLDLWGGERLDDIDHVEDVLLQCVQAAGATLLHTHLHHFTPNGGVTGVLVLAESHISIHTWPEEGFAALDIFMCGEARPHAAVPILKQGFQPEHMAISENRRGLTA